MIKATYIFSPTMLRTGVRCHYLHRHIILTLLLPALGLIFLLYGSYHLFFNEHPSHVFGGLLIALGTYYIVLIRRRITSATKDAFKANPNERQVTLVFTEESVSITDGENEGTTTWASFVDFKICKTGILLYPQKNLFYWIPDTATTEGASWHDLQSLVTQKITRKL